MVYANDCKPGAQEFRDKLRCQEIESNQNTDVWTYDDRHPEIERRCDRIGNKLVERSTHLTKHIHGNFAILRRFIHNIEGKFGTLGKMFDVIVVDHFNGPTGWAAEKWVNGFIKDVIPYIGRHYLFPDGEIWLPAIPAVRTAVHETFVKILNMFLVKDETPEGNPVYRAGEDIAAVLEQQHPPVCNKNALRSLPHPFPFLLLRLKPSVAACGFPS